MPAAKPLCSVKLSGRSAYRCCRAHTAITAVYAPSRSSVVATMHVKNRSRLLSVAAAAASAAGSGAFDGKDREDMVKSQVGAPSEATLQGNASSSSSSSGKPTDVNAAGVKTMQDLESYPREFVMKRLLAFVGIVLGYSCYYLTRNSLTYTAPVMVADAALKMDITQVGVMTSIFPIAYGFSKFASGVLGARSSPSLLLGGGLIATALVNLCFGFGASMTWFCCFWALNGILQGFGGPCCARILTAWFATKERGTYWGMWNIAHNLGGFMAPIVCGTAARNMGWRWGMWAPGIIGVVVGMLVLAFVRDSPEAIGYPPIEEIEVAKAKNADGSDSEADEEKKSLMTLLVENVLRNPYIWGMALTYFCIYVVRQGVTSWFVFYLMKAKGVTDAGSAAVRVSGMEVGGLFGSLLAGRLSDALIKKYPQHGAVGKRVQVVIGYTIGVAAMLLAFKLTPATAIWAQWASVFMIGFFLYGPQMLIGLCGAELVGPESVGASEGFLGWVAYLGAANAGVPLSIIVKQYGWNYYFVTLWAACAVAILLLLPMVNLKNFVQREAARKAAFAKPKTA